MKKSFIIPTCSRPQMFIDCINQIYLNTTHKKRVEILVIADNTDTVSQEYVKKEIALREQFFGSFRLLVRPRSDLLNQDYYNWAADQSTGEVVWIFADDLMLVAPDWDTVLEREYASFVLKHPDKIFTISMKDNTPPPSHRLPKFPCFPMFTREARKALGFWLHPKPKNWGVDYINFKIFSGIDRILEIHDRNYINHVSHHTHQVQPDATAIRIGQLFNMSKMIPHHNTDRILAEEVPAIQNELKKYIENIQSTL